MEDLSRSEYMRLSITQREAYLSKLLGDYGSESEAASDSEDEDWIPYNTDNATDRNESTDECNEDRLEADEDVKDDSECNESETNDERNETTNAYVAKDKTEWQKTPFIENTIIRCTKRLLKRMGPHISTDTLSIADTFKKIMTIDMVSLIVRHTNNKAVSVYEAYNAAHPDSKRNWKPIDIREMYSFMGLLICSGANNTNTDRLVDMWHYGTYPIYRATMGYRRFQNILHFIRFDDIDTREQRLKEDKTASISELWTILSSNLSNIYNPKVNLKIEEQLYHYHGPTKRFSQYYPSKLAKVGSRILWICDAENGYPLQGIICSGDANQDEKIVKDLLTPYRCSGRTVCMDEQFTTLRFAKELLLWDLNTVGKLKKNPSYVPRAMASCKSRDKFSSLFGFHQGVTLCSYLPKRNKSVLVISTKHSDVVVNDDANKMPHIVEYYYKNKIEVDSMDQMINKYTTQRRTTRWSLAMFFNILDISCLASYIIYYENNDMIKKKSNERRLFMRQLSEELAKPSIEERACDPKVIQDYFVKIAIECMLGQDVKSIEADSEPVQQNEEQEKKDVGLCYICNSKKNRRTKRKTRKYCSACDRAVCVVHCKNHFICNKCEK